MTTTIIKNDPATYRLRTKLAAVRPARVSEQVFSRAEVEAALRQADPHGYITWPPTVQKREV